MIKVCGCGIILHRNPVLQNENCDSSRKWTFADQWLGFFVRIDIFIINSELSWKFLLLKYIPSISVGVYLLQTVCLTRNNSPLNRKITAVVKRDYTTATDKFIDLQWVVSHSIKLRKQPLNFLCQNDFHTMDRNV